MEKIRILIPTDFSEQAEFAYLMIKKLEEKIPIEIHFLHVMDAPDTVTIGEYQQLKTCGEIDMQYLITHREIVEHKLANLKSLYGSGVNTHFVLGRLTDQIINVAKTLQADLIVMGNKSIWGLKEKLSGSTSQMVVRRSVIPVLSLMCTPSESAIRQILLVHDFNAPPKEDLLPILKWIKIFDSRFHLLQITSAKAATDTAGLIENMKHYAALNQLDNYECHVINDKDVENGVVHFNQMINMDLVCIGTHGKGGLFHSSATEKLINHLFKPIISFRLN